MLKLSSHISIPTGLLTFQNHVIAPIRLELHTFLQLSRKVDQRLCFPRIAEGEQSGPRDSESLVRNATQNILMIRDASDEIIYELS